MLDNNGSDVFNPLFSDPLILDSVEEDSGKGNGFIDETIFDSAADGFAEQQLRSEAMAIALTWVDDEDHTFDSLISLIAGSHDLILDSSEGDDDADDSLTDVEASMVNDSLEGVADALVTLGANEESVLEFINDSDNDAGEKIGERLTDILDDANDSDDDIIIRHAVGAKPIMDAIITRMTSDGKIKRRKKPTKKFKMSAKHRQNLKKMQKKPRSAASKRKQKKTMRKRKQRGL